MGQIFPKLSGKVTDLTVDSLLLMAEGGIINFNPGSPNP